MSDSDPFYDSACLPSSNLQNPAQFCQAASGLSIAINGQWLLAEEVRALLIQALQPQEVAGLQTPGSLTETVKGLNMAIYRWPGNQGSACMSTVGQTSDWSCCGADVMKNVRTVQYEELSEEQIRAARMRRSRDRWNPSCHFAVPLLSSEGLMHCVLCLCCHHTESVPAFGNVAWHYIPVKCCIARHWIECSPLLTIPSMRHLAAHHPVL